MNTTISGCTAPTVAATPPGRRETEINNKLQNSEILSAPRMKMRIHQIPVGICRTIITSNNPAGNARSIATVIGEKFGRYWVVTM